MRKPPTVDFHSALSIKRIEILFLELAGLDWIENQKLLLYRQEQATTRPRSDAVPTALIKFIKVNKMANDKNNPKIQFDFNLYLTAPMSHQGKTT
jgi:hypothetical protein